MFKDTVCAKIDVDTYGFRLVESYKPVFPVRSDAELHKWFGARQTPYSRDNMADVYKFCNLQSIEDFIRITKFCGVNDCWWIKTKTSQNWSNVNLFDNSFDPFISDLCLYGEVKVIPNRDNLYSPEFCLGGSFPKTWRHINHEIMLLKGDKQRQFKELINSSLYSEVFANQICDYLGWTSFVKYEIKTYKDLDVCVCKCFTSKNVMYYPAVYFLSGYPSYEKVKELFGTYNLFYDMIFLDCITLNIDRHTGNYGFLVDSNTLDNLGMSPIYDNNYCLLSSIPVKPMSKADVIKYIHACRSRFDDELFINLVKKLVIDYPKVFDYCIVLKDFNLQLDNIDSVRLRRLNFVIHYMIDYILSLRS